MRNFMLIDRDCGSPLLLKLVEDAELPISKLYSVRHLNDDLV